MTDVLRAADDMTATADGASGPAVRGVAVLPPRWRLEQLLGSGGQADVWLATDLEVGQRVAVKVFHDGISPTQRERLRQEVRLGRSLSHPGLVRVFELIDAGGRPAVVMEWIEGGSLAERLGGGPLPFSEVVSFARETLEALAYLHQRGIIHRDVKPSNLLLGRDGRLRLADLGLVRELDRAAGLTRTATTVGTAGYMSPEQIRGRPLTPASDLYSLGVTLFHLVTAVPPFSGNSEFEVADQHLRSAVPDPRRLRPDCPAWLSRLVMRLLEKRPADRFAGAAAVLRALERHRSAPSPRRIRRAGTLLAAAAAAVVLGGAAASLWRGEPAAASVVGRTVVVSDARGRELWRRSFDGVPFDGVPFAAVVSGAGGSDRDRVAVALDEHTGTIRQGRPRIAVFAANGTELTSVSGTAQRLSDEFHQTPEARLRTFRAEDLDGDGTDELLWLVTHPVEDPASLTVWMPSKGLQPTPVLSNSGHLHTLATADLDGDGADELVVTGINNPMGFQTVLAIARVRRAGDLPALEEWLSPDVTRRWTRANHAYPSRDALSYVPLGPWRGETTVVAAGPDGITLDSGGSRIELDAAGNPRGLPLYGHGSLTRDRFWIDLADTCTSLQSGSAQGQAQAQRFMDDHSGVLTEKGSRVAAELLLGRALAGGGNHSGAARLLRSAAGRDPDVMDLWLRLGEQEFLAGDRRAALVTLAQAALPRRAGRPRDQARLARGIAATLMGDAASGRAAEEGLRAVGTESPSQEGPLRELRALRSFALDATRAPSLDPDPLIDDLPTIAVARLWARLHNGEAPDTLEPAVQEARANPRIREASGVLLAEIRRTGGDLDRALALATESLGTLQSAARTSLESYFWCALAEHETGVILAEQGRAGEAATHFRAAAAMAPGCWFGRLPR